MIVIVMGVTGSGKTTIGRLLADTLGWRFYDADDYHPRSNIEMMRDGIPLSDEDRAPWLDTLHNLIATCVAHKENAVLACSALKYRYRRQLQVDPTHVAFVYLKGTPALLQERLVGRRDHFMPRELLDSQIAALEEPGEGLTFDIALLPAQIVANVISVLHL